MIQCQIHVRQSLRLYTLRRVHHQDGAVTGSQAPGYLIIKIHMSWCIDQIENIFLSIFRLVDRPHSLCLDRNPTLPFQLHVVQNLGLHLTAGQKSGHFNNPVCQCGFSMVDMCNNTKIPNIFLLYSCHLSSSLSVHHFCTA